MSGYKKDIRLERKFTPEIKQILGDVFITQDSVLDKEQATDFLIFTVNISKVAARLRTYKHYLKPDRRDEFTIRYTRPSGALTEIDKIRKGLVGYIFYGFVNEEEKRILQWFIGDFEIFRKNEPKPYAIYSNKPRDSDLAVYKLNQFPESFIIASYGLHINPKSKTLGNWF